jgi:hypothetical protein
LLVAQGFSVQVYFDAERRVLTGHSVHVLPLHELLLNDIGVV